ncbi:MAG TPA: hypothetical protein VII28_11700 [Puia sp.]
MNMQGVNLVIIPEEELANLKKSQVEILNELKNLRAPIVKAPFPNHITAKEYMSAVKICRSKFDQLVATNKIKTVKKKRKIYLPFSEVERYFTDPTIE